MTRSSFGRPRRAVKRTDRTPYRLRFERLEDRTLLATFVVSNTADSGTGSLRDAITQANNTSLHPGLDTINFNIAPGGVQTIRPASPLPTITDPVVIDGTTQPGF